MGLVSTPKDCVQSEIEGQELALRKANIKCQGNELEIQGCHGEDNTIVGALRIPKALG
jgi:hypothetical protein